MNRYDPYHRVDVYHSAAALYHAPSDLSGIGGMHHEYIHATPSWKRGDARHDCVFIEKDADEVGFRALCVAQVQTFISFYLVFGSPVSEPEKDCNRTGPRPQKTGPVVRSFHF